MSEITLCKDINFEGTKWKFDLDEYPQYGCFLDDSISSARAR